MTLRSSAVLMPLVVALIACSSNDPSGAPTATTLPDGGDGTRADGGATSSGVDAASPAPPTLERCLRECDDPTCEALTVCVGLPTLEPGWSGPVALYTGNDEPPACDAAFSGEAFVGGELSLVTPLVCLPPTCQATNGACVATALPPPAPPPVTWSTRAKTCQASMGGGFACAKGVCAPRPSAAFRPKPCITKAGKSECPLGSPYSQRLTFASSFTDLRRCSDPACSGTPETGCMPETPVALNQVATAGDRTVCCLP